MTEKLPSIDDFYEELPSVDEIITEEKLPSVDEFIEPPRPEEEIADEIQQSEEEPVDTAPCSIEEQYTEFVRLVNDVREDIPEIPEIKYYDEQIAELSTTMEEIKENIPEVPEQKSYDEEIEAICGLIDDLKEEVRTNAADIPEIRYYDDQIERLETSLKSLPEIRHYEGDLTSIRDEIVLIKESIPVFPKWVNEVNEVPDFSWIGKQFSVIDDDFVKAADNADSIRNRITEEVRQLSEDLETKRFESKTEIKDLTQNFTETKEKIYEELRTAAVGILDIKHSFKNDDRLLKKQIMSKYNLLKLNVEEKIDTFNKTNEDTKDLYAGYFESLTEEISNLPKVKYYEEDIKNVREEFAKGLDSLKILVEDIRQKQKLAKDEIENIQEGLLNEPPENTQSVGTDEDPLAPLDKQFPNLKSLADHYRLFINRTQQQLAVVGGGGAGFIKDLSDVSFTESTGTNKLLIYNGDEWVGIASTALSPIITLNDALTNGNVSGIGISVGVVTATNGYFSGIVTAAQLNYDVVTDIYSTGIVTATKGIQVTTLGLNVASGISTLTDGLRVGSAATIYANGNIAAAGIVTANGGFVGALTGNVTGNATGLSGTPNITIGDLVGASLDISGNADIDGTLEADAITVDGTALNEYIADTVGGMVSSNTESGITVAYQDADNTLDFTVGTLNQDTTGNAATATALETARNIGGVSFDGSANINLPGVNEAGNQNTSGTAAGLTGSPTITVTAVNVGTAATVSANGNATFSGIVTATSFVGSGANLTGLPAGVTINTNADNRIITGSDTANTLNGESGLTYDGSTLAVTGAGSYTGDVTLTSTGTDSAAGPIVNLYRNSSSPADADYLGQIKFQGENDNDQQVNYAKITGKISDASDGSEDGILEFAFIKAGSQNINARFKSTELQLINGTDLSVAGDTTFTGTIDANSTSDFGGTITLSSGQFNVGTAATIYANGNVTAGIVTATSFVGDGSALTGVGASEEDTAVSSTSATTVLSFAKADYRAAFIKLLVTQGSAYQSGKYSLIHDGTTVTVVEENAIATGSMLGTFSGTISGDNVLFQVTMGSSSSATVTILKDLVTV